MGGGEYLFTGYAVETSNAVAVSHLQFADDTLLLGAKSWANLRVVCKDVWFECKLQ